jgi:alpha-galactosidase/6-phospho-beta-glucosidase family protein
MPIHSSINTMIAGINYFFFINDIVLNKKKISRYMGEHVKTVKNRAYTNEEIKKYLNVAT